MPMEAATPLNNSIAHADPEQETLTPALQFITTAAERINAGAQTSIEERTFLVDLSLYVKYYTGLGHLEGEDAVELVAIAYMQSKENPNNPVIVDLSGLSNLRFSPPLPPGITILNMSGTQIKEAPKLPVSLIEFHAFRSELKALPDNLHEGLRVINLNGTFVQTLPGNLPDSIQVLRIPEELVEGLPLRLRHAVNPEGPISDYEKLIHAKENSFRSNVLISSNLSDGDYADYSSDENPAPLYTDTREWSYVEQHPDSNLFDYPSGNVLGEALSYRPFGDSSDYSSDYEDQEDFDLAIATNESNQLQNQQTADEIKAEYKKLGGVEETFILQKPNEVQRQIINSFIDKNLAQLTSGGVTINEFIIEISPDKYSKKIPDGIDTFSFESFDPSSNTEWCLCHKGGNKYILITANTVQQVINEGLNHPFGSEPFLLTSIIRGAAMMKLIGLQGVGPERN
jgi:hypothetical protein